MRDGRAGYCPCHHVQTTHVSSRRDRGAIKVEVIRRREQAVRSMLWKEDDDQSEHTSEKKGGMVRLVAIGG
jgi:hypothetical protein